MNDYDRLTIIAGICAILSAVAGHTNYPARIIFGVCGLISLFMKRTKEQA